MAINQSSARSLFDIDSSSAQLEPSNTNSQSKPNQEKRRELMTRISNSASLLLDGINDQRSFYIESPSTHQIKMQSMSTNLSNISARRSTEGRDKELS